MSTKVPRGEHCAVGIVAREELDTPEEASAALDLYESITPSAFSPMSDSVAPSASHAPAIPTQAPFQKKSPANAAQESAAAATFAAKASEVQKARKMSAVHSNEVAEPNFPLLDIESPVHPQKAHKPELSLGSRSLPEVEHSVAKLDIEILSTVEKKHARKRNGFTCSYEVMEDPFLPSSDLFTPHPLVSFEKIGFAPPPPSTEERILSPPRKKNPLLVPVGHPLGRRFLLCPS